MIKHGVGQLMEEEVHACATSNEGLDQLHAIGVETHSLDPPITFIPTIMFNGVSHSL